MLYSTLSRFQGAICGSTISPSFLNQLVIFQAKSLIESGTLDFNNIKSLEKLTTSQIAIASLPLILFFHESPQLLTEKLTAIVTQINKPAETLQELLIWGKALALALQEKLQPQNLIAQLLQSNTETKLEQQLEQVQTYLEQDLSLHQVVGKLSRRKEQEQTALALAIYCFAFTPEDFNLATSRASLGNYQRETTVTLTGILAGVYNGYHGIPLKLRLSLEQDYKGQISTTIARQLYASWCGITEFGSTGWQKPTQAIAITGLIQPRTQLKIISQQNSW
jgi:hypothetical protein